MFFFLRLVFSCVVCVVFVVVGAKFGWGGGGGSFVLSLGSKECVVEMQHMILCSMFFVS